MKVCHYCGAPITFSSLAGGWLHALPLADFKISRRELADILADPPPPKLPLMRGSHIHPAEPRRPGRPKLPEGYAHAL